MRNSSHIFIAIPALLCITVLGQTPRNGSALVLASPSLTLRESPSRASRALAAIPFKTVITVSREYKNQEIIGGALGYWQRTTYEGKTGWIFGGLLLDEEQDQPLDLRLGDAYQAIFPTLLGPTDYNFGVRATGYQARGNFLAMDFRVGMPNNPQSMCRAAIVRLEDNKVIPVGGGTQDVCSYEFLDINEDNIPDALAASGCCVTSIYSLLLGTKDGNFKQIASITLLDHEQVRFVSKGRCESFHLKGPKREIYFDCKAGKLVDHKSQ